MAFSHQYGKPINILKLFDTEDEFNDKKEFEKVFNNPKIQDYYVVIISIIGACRSGKSFLLNLILMFLYAHFPSINNPNKVAQLPFKKDDRWMGNSDDPVKGFSWRPGIKSDTVGINIWSDVFLHTMENSGEKLAIFIMDTQGLFDNISTQAENLRIFALPTMMSSIKIFNFKNIINENELQYLQYATEIAKFMKQSKENKNITPFQKLIFLIRDWYYYEEYNFGLDGGKRYIKDETFKIDHPKAPELSSVRESIVKSYKTIECCVLPHPGKNVASKKHYDGRWSEMDEVFVSEIKIFIESIFNPKNLAIKEVCSQRLNVKNLKVYIEECVALFQSEKVPNAQSLYQLNIECFSRNIIENCLEKYTSEIQIKIHNYSLKQSDHLMVDHIQLKDMTLEMYEKTSKFFDECNGKKYRDELENKIEKRYSEIISIIKSKQEDYKKQSIQYKIKLDLERRQTETATSNNSKLNQQRTIVNQDSLKILEELRLIEIEQEKVSNQNEKDWLIQVKCWKKQNQEKCKTTMAGNFIDTPRIARGHR